MYLTHNKGKCVIAEGCIKVLKNKIYKYMTWLSKNVYIDKLNDIVKLRKMKDQSTIKMKPVDIYWLS